jgi:hypothetical protein
MLVVLLLNPIIVKKVIAVMAAPKRLAVRGEEAASGYDWSKL